MIKGFKEFILRGNVIDLAVAVVIGAAFTLIVNSIVAGLINPLIALIFQADSLDGAVSPVTVQTTTRSRSRWGRSWARSSTSWLWPSWSTSCSSSR